MSSTMRIKFFTLILSFQVFLLQGDLPDPNNLSTTKDNVFFLTTPRSGCNFISGCLVAITRKPVWWLNWKMNVYSPTSIHKHHPSYNRLQVPLVDETPLFYRSHFEYDQLMQIPSDSNKLIFVTRNPKELLYRAFNLQRSGNEENPNVDFVKTYLDEYLKAFTVFDSWTTTNRCIIFYEDFIASQDDVLIAILQFMNEEPTFYEDYLEHKEEYTAKLFESYQRQHEIKLGGRSSIDGPKAIYYTKNASKEVLHDIDDYLKEHTSSDMWTLYLKRFSEDDRSLNVQ